MAVSMLAATAAQASSLESHQTENLSSGASSPHQYPTDLTSPILEEGDETESEPVNEPITPVSGRQSQDFDSVPAHTNYPDNQTESLSSSTSFGPVTPTITPTGKTGLVVDTNLTPRPRTSELVQKTSKPPATPSATEQEPIPGSLSRRQTRTSISGVKRTMTSLFRRTNSQSDKAAFGVSDSGFMPSSDPNFQDAMERKTPNRRWSMNRSSNTTRSNTPPSPSSPSETPAKTTGQPSKATVPQEDEFFSKDKAKQRASTGLHLRARVGFSGHHNAKGQRQDLRRRASSVDYTGQELPAGEESANPIHMERSLWGMPAETGTGVKARRMSLSLPDDFTVDVAELLGEFEYQHKFLGRHGKHLGKGATSKVTLMVRKGCPTELYAVKEFRGKSSSETAGEYEKKIKSEYTLAKSLHHPNIVETIRLCTDHGRWNHVMEYCSEGDLFTLVNKKYLKAEDREKDRLCLFKQLVQGINYLHTNGIAHRDIKLENLLVSSDSKLKITDFGVSEVFSGIHPGLREAGGLCGRNMGEIRLCAPGICGSEPYIAPEVLKKQGRYDPRALDVWSSAIVMINLIFGAPLWQRAELAPSNPKPHPNYTKLVKGWEKWEAKNTGSERIITEADYPKVDAFDFCVKPPALRRLLLQMLNPEPSKRISIADVLNNRWVKNIECCQLESYEDPAKSIDASKKLYLNRGGQRKIFCHNHLPPREHNTHSLGKMPGSAGY